MGEKRNILGRLKKALDDFDSDAQKRTACVFVRHASQMLSAPKRERVLATVDVLESFLAGETEIDATKTKVHDFVDDEWSTSAHSSDGWSETLSRVGSVVRLLELACCQRELAAARLMIIATRYQPDAFAVGLEAARGFASSREQRQNELRWQLSYVLRHLRGGRMREATDGTPDALWEGREREP